MSNNTIVSEILEIYYQISDNARGISILSFTVDYKSHLVEASNTLKALEELEDKDQIASSMVRAYYTSNKFREMEFSDFLPFYLQGLKDSLKVFAELDGKTDGSRKH